MTGRGGAAGWGRDAGGLPAGVARRFWDAGDRFWADAGRFRDAAGFFWDPVPDFATLLL